MADDLPIPWDIIMLMKTSSTEPLLRYTVSSEGKKILETEPINKVKRFISKLNSFGTSLMELPLGDKERYIDGFKYVEMLNLIIPKITMDGNAVIVGRGWTIYFT